MEQKADWWFQVVANKLGVRLWAELNDRGRQG